MIKPSAEMRDAFYADGDERCEIPGCIDCFDDRLSAVLAIVERDYRLDRICREELMPGVHCARPAHVRGDHEAALPGGSAVKWS